MTSSDQQAPAKMDSEAVRSWLLLAMVPGVGPLLRKELLDRFGSADAVLAAAPSELRQVPRLGPKLCSAIATAAETIDVEAELQRCRDNEIRIISPWKASYPAALKEISDPPAVLFMKGDLLPQDDLAVAIVGTRHATHYGRQQAQRLATSLARAGVTIVSGLARGIDTEAHQAALEADGRTVAVLGSGLLNVYPSENKTLAEQIAKCGAVISESSCEAKPARGAFPRRNRIITGMCHGVVVVEAGDRSGALISARLSMEQGRDVFAVPGRVDSRTSRGCHQLIRDGAKLVETADDVLEELGPLFQASTDAVGREVRRPSELQLNEQEREVLVAILDEPTSIEVVVERCGLPVHRVLSTISVLEMRGLVQRLSGTQVLRR